MPKGVPIPNDWDESDGYSLVTFCIPNSRQWRSVVIPQIEDFSYGRFWSRESGTITQAQTVGREIFNSMSICQLDQLILAVQQIAAAVSAPKSICGCTNGPGVVQVDGEPFFGSEEPMSDPESFGGPGDEFPTQAAFLAHKCVIANGIVDAIISTLNAFSALSLAQLLAGVGILAVSLIAGLVFAPPLALLIALAATAFAFGLFAGIATELDNRREELVCALYASPVATDAYNNLKQVLLDVLASLEISGVQLDYIVDIVLNIAPIDTMNKLYTSLGLPANWVNPIDCSVCGCTIIWTFDNGAQSWVFTDTSPPAQGTTTGMWVSDGLQMNISIPNPNNSATGEFRLDTTSLGLTVTIGDTITVFQDESPIVTASGIGGVVAGVPQATQNVSSAASSFTHVFNAAGSLDSIVWTLGNSTGSNSNFTNDRRALEVVLFLQNVTPCPSP